MKIVLNGAWRDIALRVSTDRPPPLPTLETVLNYLGFGNAVLATALNGEFVAVGARARISVREGDRLEVLAPMQGG